MIVRVFPRKTKASPDDNLAFYGPLPRNFDQEAKEIHISVAFTYDLPKAEKLYKSWSKLGLPVKVGGPAFNSPGEEFVPGRYLRHGYTITSRGCNNRCWFCQVPRREGGLRELPIRDGWIVTDDNILACSKEHFSRVIEMLKRQPEKPRFVGGLEAKLLTPWHARLLKEAKTKALYCAYDTADDLDPLVNAGKILREAGFTARSHTAACYVLIGYHGDTFDKAEKRLTDTIKVGFVPYAMLYKDKRGEADPAWRSFQREWCRPQIVGCKMRNIQSSKGGGAEVSGA